MTQYQNRAFNQFITNMHELFAKKLPEVQQWEGVKPLLSSLLEDQEFQRKSRDWVKKKGREYILHHDTKYDFFVGALVREPKHVAMAHDHGPTWTIYGVLDGEEIVRADEIKGSRASAHAERAPGLTSERDRWGERLRRGGG